MTMRIIRTAIIEIVRNFKLIPVTKIEDIEMETDFVLKTKQPFQMKFLSRSDNCESI